jgi:hypothetical protein
VQVEMSRDLYLRPKYFDRHSLKIDHGRLAELNARFEEALRLFFELWKPSR